MKKTLVPVILIVALLFTSLPAMAWRGGYGPRYYRGGPGIGGVIGGLIVGGLIAGTVVAATRPPVQVVSQPGYVTQPGPRMCTEERRVTGEYQYDANGNAVWVQFPQPMVRSYQVPCP